MPSIPPPAYQVTSPSRVSRPVTTQQPSYYKPTTPLRTPPPPPPSVTTQPVSYYKPTTPFRTPPPSVSTSLGRGAKFFSKVPKGGSAALAIAFELLFSPPAGDNYYDRNPKNPPPKYKLQPPEPAKVIEPPVPPPFKGGQSPGISYFVRVRYRQTENYFGTIYIVEGELRQGGFYGLNSIFVQKIGDRVSIFANCLHHNSPDLPGGDIELYGQTANITLEILSIEIGRSDGQPDLGGDPPPLSNGNYSPPGNSLGAPSAAPPSAAPSPAPTAPPSTAPAPQPKRYPGPAPAPNPVPTPQPNRYPGPVPNPNPYPTPNGNPGPQPGPGVGAPSPSPTPTTAPKPGPLPYTSPPPADPTKYLDTGFQPKIFQPNPLTPQPDFQPNPLTPNPLEPQKFQPNPKTGDPEPKAPPLIIPPPTTPAPTTTPTDDLRKQIDKYLGPLAIVTAGIAALVQPDKLKAAANAGTCQALAPGGCGASLSNNAQAAATNSANNGTALASIMAFLQAIQNLFLIPIRAGVELINTKLGPVMSGLNGIGGFLSRTAEAAKLAKVLNAMNTILLLHNAAMLSRNLSSTLGDLTSQALATIGIKDGDSPIDVNEILGKQANSFMESLVGAEVWKGTKTSCNKASSIISSATNLMYTVRSMFDSTREIMEWTAENTGKIGNALKRFRVVGENAYKWLPERVTVQNRFTRQIDRIREGTDSLDDAASSLSGVLGEVQSIQQEYADLQEQKQKFDKNISELTPKTRVENKPVSDAVTTAKNASKAPTEIENVFRGEGTLTNA